DPLSGSVRAKAGGCREAVNANTGTARATQRPSIPIARLVIVLAIAALRMFWSQKLRWQDCDGIRHLIATVLAAYPVHALRSVLGGQARERYLSGRNWRPGSCRE